MKHLRQVWTVTRWEFMRYFKWKQELAMLAILLMFYVLLGFGQAALQFAKSSKHYEIGMIDHSQLAPDASDAERITLQAIRPAQEKWAREQVGLRQIDGLLIIHSRDKAELLAYSEPRFLEDLSAILDGARRQSLLTEAGVSVETYDNWTQPLPLEVQYHERGDSPASRGERVMVILFLIMVLSATVTSFAYFFVSITSEKQARVAEQIVSAIPTQAWIDGKILGISGHGLKAVVSLTLLAGLVVMAIAQFNPTLLASAGSIEPAKVVVGLLFVIAGILFWSAFMAGVAATIDDPNSSARSSVMFIPMLPVFLAFATLDHPELGVVTFLSWFPVTSMAFMPLRYALIPVGLWEVVGSLLLLSLTVWVMRRYASRIFRAGMFLYGKEPSWREMLRWMRSGQGAWD